MTFNPYSGSLTYYYPEELNSPGTVNCSVAETVRCHQSVNSARLQGRSWYISQDKAYFGIFVKFECAT